MGKKNTIHLKKQIYQRESLSHQITNDEFVISPKKSNEKIFEDGDFPSLPTKISKKSFIQLKKIPNEDGEVNEPRPSLSKKKKKKQKAKKSMEDLEDGNELVEYFSTPANIDKLIEDFTKELDIDKDDKAQEEFFPDKPGPQQKLEDLFRERITEKHTEIQSKIDEQSVIMPSLTPETQEMMKEVGKILSKYRSGPLPKIFKVVPKMKGWEELVHLTSPDSWSAAAMYQATRIFVSNLHQSMAQRFLNLILLPRVRDDISYYKRLNYHIYQALCKALFKPAAFLKGILFPLCVSGDCTLREAIIIGSVIAKNQIPMLHSASAILKIAEMEYTGPNSIFLRIFFDKKYALPYRVVDAVAYHFIKFESDRRDLPVLWYQSFLAFVQKYKEDLSFDQKEALFRVLRFHNHFKVTPEIRRELQNSNCREEPMVTE